VRGHTYQPSAHSYYLRQRLPVVRKENAFIAGDAAGLATRTWARASALHQKRVDGRGWQSSTTAIIP